MASNPGLLGCTDEALFRIASFLGAADLLSLLLTAQRCAAKTVTGTASAGVIETQSLMAEVARTRTAARSAVERGWAPRSAGQSWLAVAWELERLSMPLTFARSHAYITVKETGAVADLVETEGYRYRCAATDTVMRSGRHYAEFTLVTGQGSPDNHFGVIRPNFDVASQQSEAHRQGGHCFFWTHGGCFNSDADLPPRNHRVEKRNGMRDWNEPGAKVGVRFGMLLDLDQGSMTVFKNDALLGVMVNSGLSGQYCWAATLYEFGDSIRIDASKPVPPVDLLGGTP